MTGEVRREQRRWRIGYHRIPRENDAMRGLVREILMMMSRSTSWYAMVDDVVDELEWDL